MEPTERDTFKEAIEQYETLHQCVLLPSECLAFEAGWDARNAELLPKPMTGQTFEECCPSEPEIFPEHLRIAAKMGWYWHAALANKDARIEAAIKLAEEWHNVANDPVLTEHSSRAPHYRGCANELLRVLGREK